MKKVCKQDHLLHPVLVHNRKNKKIQPAKWGTSKIIFKKIFLQNDAVFMKYSQIWVWTTASLGTPKLWRLLTGGRCSEVNLCYSINQGSDDPIRGSNLRWLIVQNRLNQTCKIYNNNQSSRVLKP
jgi:hypothetical protein